MAWKEFVTHFFFHFQCADQTEDDDVSESESIQRPKFASPIWLEEIHSNKIFNRQKSLLSEDKLKELAAAKQSEQNAKNLVQDSDSEDILPPPPPLPEEEEEQEPLVNGDNHASDESNQQDDIC